MQSIRHCRVQRNADCSHDLRGTAPTQRGGGRLAVFHRLCTTSSSCDVSPAGPSRPQAARLWRDVASAAESGWDFSSRWFRDGASLATIRTTLVVPADLNAFLLKAESAIASLARDIGDCATAEAFDSAAAARREALLAVHWDQAAGRWRDRVLPEDAPGARGAEGSVGPVDLRDLGADVYKGHFSPLRSQSYPEARQNSDVSLHQLAADCALPLVA